MINQPDHTKQKVKATAWAKVILPLALPQVYTYHIPQEMMAAAKPGCRAEVIFGKNKHYAGIIKEVETSPPDFPTKPILQILDDVPLVQVEQLKLWEWMADYYMCSEGEVMNAALPLNFKLSSETILLFNEEFEDEQSLSTEEFIVAEALRLKRQMGISEVQKLLEINHVYPVVKRLVEKGVCVVWEKMSERYKPRKEKFVRLHPSVSTEEQMEALLNDWQGAPRQMELLLAFLHLSRTVGEVKQSELLKKSGCTAAQLNALIEKQILLVEVRRVDRLPVPEGYINEDFELNQSQEEAYRHLLESMKEKAVNLIHGVTGSGKTLLYVKQIAACFREGNQALILVPEIALTAQLVRRLQHYFGGYISVYHSRFNDQERVELWNKVRQNEARIILGARSALFLPFKNLRLIVVDEEHDPSYKQQDPAPRYNARDTAIVLAEILGAKVILGSATPSMESYYNALQKRYGLIEMHERYGGISLPTMEILNTTHATRAAKSRIMISEGMATAIQETLEKNQQVILFQNRRGYNPYLICGSCGYIPKCEQCDVSLTMHKAVNKLQCHYCGSIYPVLIACPACGVLQWMEKNFGTEKIEELLESTFSDHVIARMDIDTVKGKSAHDVLLQRFEQGDVDILVGTQMVVKGLDFDNVGLVGILDADGLLNFTDFRVNERAFQLMEQVSGRAGRKHQQGRVLIQSVQEDHPVLQMVRQHNYHAFYEWELGRRKEFFYPPFSRILRIILKHSDFNKVNLASEKLATAIKAFAPNLSGPAAPAVARVRGMYIMEIMIKLFRNAQAANVKRAILHEVQLLKAEKVYSSVQVIFDVDPS